MALPGIPYGGLRFPASVAAVTGDAASVGGPLVLVIGRLALALASLAANYRHNPEQDMRRKVRVILWGTVVGVVPGLLDRAVTNFTPYRTPALTGMLHPSIAAILPLSFAYAVVEHRVLEIPFLLKRSARYLFMQRGCTLMLSVVSIGLTVVFASWFDPHLRADEEGEQSGSRRGGRIPAGRPPSRVRAFAWASE
jgi:hypothetical protein